MKRIRTAAAYLAAIEIWPVAFFVAASVVYERVLPLALGVAGLFRGIRWLANFGRALALYGWLASPGQPVNCR